jgi:hypothetical protein
MTLTLPDAFIRDHLTHMTISVPREQRKLLSKWYHTIRPHNHGAMLEPCICACDIPTLPHAPIQAPFFTFQVPRTTVHFTHVNANVTLAIQDGAVILSEARVEPPASKNLSVPALGLFSCQNPRNPAAYKALLGKDASAQLRQELEAIATEEKLPLTRWEHPIRDGKAKASDPDNFWPDSIVVHLSRPVKDCRKDVTLELELRWVRDPLKQPGFQFFLQKPDIECLGGDE